MFFASHCRRISEYSPTDNNKANERAVNRRNNVRFNPKATIEILVHQEKERTEGVGELNDNQKLDLVEKYLEVRKKYFVSFVPVYHLKGNAKLP